MTWRARPMLLVALAIATVAVLAGCNSSPASRSRESAAAVTVGTVGQPLAGSITVLAAASLTGTFTELGRRFAAAHPEVKVNFSFGSSAELATQVLNGAPGDVFAAASPSTMQTVVAARDATGPVTFARNTLEIATPPDNPAHVTKLSDLGSAGLTLALCQVQVPCGATAAAMFARAGITVHPATLEQDVKSTLAKVAAGEVDAGVVYVTDVRAAGKAVHGVPIGAADNVATTYPIVALTHSANATAARAFVAYVVSAAGQAVLTAAGFTRP